MHRGTTFQNMPPTIIMKKVMNKIASDDESNQFNQNPVVTVWFWLPYCGDKSIQLANSCVKKTLFQERH